MDVSIIIVNYNVKNYLVDCLNSIRQAVHNLSVEVIIVDNNSTDGSKDFLPPMFSEVKFIWLNDNLGFGKANNIAIKQAKGKYILLLNPDTIISEDTLLKMFQYMENNMQVGIASCKLLNVDGSFQLACRRGFPTPWAAFCKLFGLQKIFPHSKLFAKYNLTYLSENETYKVDAVCGAFMFCDGKLLKEIGGFDERYFMYGEDLDLCKQIQLKDKDIMYVPHCSTIHYKGASTKQSELQKIDQMYKAMEQFAIKYFSNSTLLITFLLTGIFLKKSLAKIFKRLQICKDKMFHKTIRTAKYTNLML
jgi:GT2 family glycosyltransferase